MSGRARARVGGLRWRGRPGPVTTGPGAAFWRRAPAPRSGRASASTRLGGARRRGPRAVERRRSARRSHTAAAWAAAFLLAVGLLAAPSLEAQGTPAGTQISNWASFSFIFAGSPYTLPSDTATVLVGQVAGVTLLPPRDRKSVV